MTKSSEKKKKSQKKSKNKSSQQEKRLDIPDAGRKVAVFEDDGRQWYIKEEAEKPDAPDDVRFTDSCPGCQDPEVFELFNDGSKVVATVNGKVVTELEDIGSGMIYRNSDGKSTRIDLCELSNLLNSLLLMDAYHEGRIIGHDEHWWVDHKGRTGIISYLLQNLKQERKTKKYVVNKDEW